MLNDKLDDKQLEHLSYEIDDYLLELANKYKCSSLSLSAIITARLVRLSMETGDTINFNKILQHAIETQSKVLQ